MPTESYGFIITPKVRPPGKYTGNITLTIPSNATCGETLFVFFLVSADSKVTEFIMPVGLVCEEEFRQGVYYESSVSNLNSKIQSLTDTVGSLNNQLQSCTAKSKDLEKQVDVLNSQLQEKDKKIATLEATLNETQSELATLQNKEKFYESGFYVLTVLLVLAVLVSITVFFVKKEKH
jgi:vacuolar-type H+-ATPase subunit I/STV1